ncbi:hypothetical protein Hanom_Chr08g00712841 [Helianthus anomalus]
MSDQNTSNAYRRLSHSPRDEGSSNPASRYVANSEDTFVFRAKYEEAFPPKKRGWFNKDKRERRKRMRNIQKQSIIRIVVGTAQIPVTLPLWEELDSRLANLDMFQTAENFLDLNHVATLEPQLLPLYCGQPIAPVPMYPEQNQEIQLSIPAFDQNDTPRLLAPNPLEQWWTNDWAF